MPGFVHDMQAALSGGDLFFFPSHGETGSIVLLEAAACGLPLIVRDLPEYRSWLEDGENCLKGCCKEEFAELIVRVTADGKLRERLSQGARDGRGVLPEAGRREAHGTLLFVANGGG
jgi:1,2-diacylglycerol-3-alpha-glucose alpha-1,2-glucosyltransferase